MGITKHYPEQWTDASGQKRLSCTCGEPWPCAYTTQTWDAEHEEPKRRPCDCESMEDVMKMSESGGVCYGRHTLFICPPNVVISTNEVTFSIIPMHIFKRLAEWYLEDQE